jgi:UDP-sugar pyrophosphorylase
MRRFVNPKYADEAKTQFKKPTRLECMMQELPRLLAPGANVGFTEMERFISFSAVKNKPADAVGKLQATGYPECASSGESDMYALNRRILAMAGCQLTPESELKKRMFLDLPFVDGARVVLGPRFGTTLAEIKAKFPTPDKVSC